MATTMATKVTPAQKGTLRGEKKGVVSSSGMEASGSANADGAWT
jgi:hypothetical protein